jgi:2-oxoglutarate dehydrogenase E1 component
MTDQSPSAQNATFLDGANADYIDQLAARHAADPASVDGDWQAFFRALGDSELDAKRAATGPSWARRDWPPLPTDDLTAALTGEWPMAPAKEARGTAEKITAKAAEAGVQLTEDQIKRAVLDSIRALMIIRAYRIRGHLAADIDPLGQRDTKNQPELDPASYGFEEADMDRPIFIDNVLGLQHASMRQIMDIVKRTYCGTFALQYMHISDPEQAAWLKERIEGYGKEIAFTREGRRAILNKLVEAEGYEKFLHQAVRPGWRRKPDPRDGTDHQARRQSGRARHRHRHAPPWPPVRARQRHGQTLPRDLPRISGRQLQTRRCGWLRRCEISPWRVL